MQKIELIYQLKSQEPHQILTMLLSVLDTVDNTDCLIWDGKKVNSSKIFSELNTSGFYIESENFIFNMSSIKSYDHTCLQIEIKNNFNEWWSCWIDKFIYLDGFIQAWLVDSEFDYWQNASDPIEYESKQRCYEGLPMISNNLPAPLEQMEIDTSHNLGLRKLCDGYVEAIGACMWFSNHFLTLVENSIENITLKSDVSVVSINSDLYKLNTSVYIFSDEGTSYEQNKLRKALYT